MKYFVIAEGRTIGEKESRIPVEFAVVATNSASGETLVVSWCKNQEAANNFVTGKKARGLVVAGATLSIVPAQTERPELPFAEPSPVEAPLVSAEEFAAEGLAIEKSAEELAIEKPTTEGPDTEGSTAEEPQGVRRFVHRHKDHYYDVVWDPKTDRVTVGNVSFNSPNAACHHVRGSATSCNGRKFFGLPPKDGGGVRSGSSRSDLATILERKLQQAEKKAVAARLKVAGLESKIHAARAELAAARALLDAMKPPVVGEDAAAGGEEATS